MSSWPVNRSMGFPHVGQVPPPVGGCFGLSGGGQLSDSNPHTPQKRGIPTPGLLATVFPSGLTVPNPADFHSPDPPIGLPSKYQI